MKPNHRTQTLQTSGVTDASFFSLSPDDTAHLMGILRRSLYTDKPAAVLREYGVNGQDANIEAGRKGQPIKVHVPTTAEPTFTVRDNGPGLSKSAVLRIYTQYGRSTKRDSDAVTGMLGIGSKAAFAYTDSFTVTSWHGSFKRIFVASLDETDVGVMQCIHEEPCDESETGIEVKVAIEPADVWDFQQTARSLFQHFDPRPDINVPLPPQPERSAVLENGEVSEAEGDWIARMGNVPYRINTSQLRALAGSESLWLPIHRLSGVLYFDIGDVEIAASREELEYTKKTKAALLAKFEALVEEYVKHTLKALKHSGVNDWTRRLRLLGLSKLGLPFPELERSLSASSARLYKTDAKPEHFIVIRDKSEVSHIGISADARLLLKNDTRHLKGYRLDYADYLIKPVGKSSVEDVRKELAEVLKKARLTGIPVVDISTEPWSEVRGTRARTHSVKHRVSAFKLVGASTCGGSKSDNWEVVSRVPKDDDVFVIIYRFEAVDHSDFYQLYNQNKRVADILGLEMPEVYGYKTTAKKPVTGDNCTGTSYREWRGSFFSDPAVRRRIRSLLRTQQWAQVFSGPWNDHWTHYYRVDGVKKARARIRAAVGASHPIAKLFEKKLKAQHALKALRDIDRRLFRSLGTLADRFGGHPKTNSAKKALETLQDRYPLLQVSNSGISVLWKPDNDYHRTGRSITFERADHWAEYIRLMDAKNAQDTEKS